MSKLVRIADNKGRISLPGFANATVILESISPNEYRIRKAEVIATDDLKLPESESPLRLSEGDARHVVAALAKPPRPNAPARRAAQRFRKRHG